MNKRKVEYYLRSEQCNLIGTMLLALESNEAGENPRSIEPMENKIDSLTNEIREIDNELRILNDDEKEFDEELKHAKE